ncbi:MAG: MarR family winged helix-turn-helix transcriptional regulator [Coprobacillaceae bacterium]
MSTNEEILYSDYIGKIIHHLYLSLDEKLLPYNITHQQARIVCYVYEGTKRKQLIHQKQLEKLIGLKGASVTSLLQGLEKKDFIYRVSDGKDARKKDIHLSEKGKKLNKKFISIFKEAETTLLDVISTDEKTIFLETLKKINQNLDKKTNE